MKIKEHFNCVIVWLWTTSLVLNIIETNVFDIYLIGTPCNNFHGTKFCYKLANLVGVGFL